MKTKYKFFILIMLACLSSIGIYYLVDKVKPVNEVKDLIAIQYDLEQEFLTDTNYTFEEPKVILNPYGISPLTALVIFETKDLTTPTIIIHGKDANTTITNTFKPAKKHILPIYGLYADKENKVTIKINNDEKVLTIKTDKLPEDFILPSLVKANKKELNNELYFVTPSSKGYTAAYDINGDVRWYLSDNFLWDIQRLNNGHLLLSTNRLINPPYYMTGLMEMDLLGKVYYEYSLPGGYHHDVYEMEDGNLLVASDNFENGTVEDYIVEIDRETGEIVKEIDLTKILPVDDGDNAYTTKYDWFHNNSVWYDKTTNSITLSGRHKDAVINIDYDSLELNWIIGSKENWNTDMHKYFFTPTNPLEWQWAQHAAMVLPNGNIFIFDNGNNRSKTIENGVKASKNYSRGVIYDINTSDMTISQVWEYGKKEGSYFYSPYISDVDYLNDNHYLIHSGGHVISNGEVSNEPAGMTDNNVLNSITVEIKDNKEIFRMELPGNYYRAEKLSPYSNDTYIKGIGIHLGTLGETKTNRNSFTLFNEDADSIIKEKKIKLTKEYDRLIVSGTFKKDDKVEIILDNLFTRKTYNMIISKKPYTAMCIDIFNEEEEKNGINVTKYINNDNMSGRYYIYMKINGTVYDFDKYVDFN